MRFTRHTEAETFNRKEMVKALGEYLGVRPHYRRNTRSNIQIVFHWRSETLKVCAKDHEVCGHG